MSYSITQIKTAIAGEYLATGDGETQIEHLLTDSRRLLFAESTLFFAISGPRRSGNAFIGELYQKGVRHFVVSDTLGMPEPAALSGANIIRVKNVLQALQALAQFHRRQFNIPVIGITGSNGKTIVKEWLYQLLEPGEVIVRNPKSYNSQVGVPLSLWQINTSHTLGIFEAGISQPDEMNHLEKMIRPTVGIFTNIGTAHSEGFLNIRQKINEKLTLFTHSKALLYPGDEPELSTNIATFAANIRSADLQLVAWGKKEPAKLRINTIVPAQSATVITGMVTRSEGVSAEERIQIPFTDEASVQNAITCWNLLLYLGMAADIIAERMLGLRPVEMRLELKQGINNCSIINDSYSADLNSLAIALDFLLQQRQHPRCTVILSDILQSGMGSRILYEEVASIIRKKQIDRFIGIGPEVSRQHDSFNGIAETHFFSSTDDFRHQFHSIHFADETVLLKGARAFGFEQISHLLEEKAHQTVLEINLGAIAHNLREYQERLAPGVKLMAMVKAFSYGSGGFEIANLLQFHKVDYLAVAYADEGVELRRAGITLPIMVLNPEAATFDVVTQYNLEPELYSFGILHDFSSYLQRNGITNYPVHIKLDTGMHRLGFEPADIAVLTEQLLTHTTLKVQSIFSHLAASDADSLDDFTHTQARLSTDACELIAAKLPYRFIRHIANTSAIHRHPNLQFDMVRLGIGLYGVDSNAAMQASLRNVSRLRTTISQIKEVKSGDSVGYNRKGVTQRDSRIATVRIGYADGYPRNLSNGTGHMWVNGAQVPVIGNVCMDMTMLDITGVQVAEGDEVEVFGERIPVSVLSHAAGTIPYEILTGISQRVKRIYFEE